MADGNSLIVPAPPRVFGAIADVMADLSVEGIAKTRRTEAGGPKFNFRGIDDVYNALSSVLAKHKLVITPRCLARQCVERKTNSGGALFVVTVEAEFILTSAEDGSSVVARTFGEAMDSSDKATNKAMSAAFKYMAMQQFCIPTEGDNDADATSHEGVQARVSLAVTAAKTAVDLARTRADLKRWKADNEAMLEQMAPDDHDDVVRHWKLRWDGLAPSAQPQSSRHPAGAEEVFA